jgi:transposase
MTDMLIVDAFRDANMTASKIARLHNVSDTYALTVFFRYVDMPRRQLTEAISIDEVSVDVPGIGKYAMVIQDFISGEPADMLPGRRKELTEPYFLAIPLGERKKVRYLISDMYSPYIVLCRQVFSQCCLCGRLLPCRSIYQQAAALTHP